MRVSNIVQMTAIAIAAALMVGCATPPTRVAQETSPKWMKYEVTGTRIRRTAGPRGDASSASFVTGVRRQRDLALMPGVVLQSPGR